MKSSTRSRFGHGSRSRDDIRSDKDCKSGVSAIDQTFVRVCTSHDTLQDFPEQLHNEATSDGLVVCVEIQRVDLQARHRGRR